jgi:hypothetical protein
MTLLAPEPVLLIVDRPLGRLSRLQPADNHALRFSATELLDTVAPDRPGWRHV